jgi:hypothetical protein
MDKRERGITNKKRKEEHRTEYVQGTAEGGESATAGYITRREGSAVLAFIGIQCTFRLRPALQKGSKDCTRVLGTSRVSRLTDRQQLRSKQGGSVSSRSDIERKGKQAPPLGR